jgi:hypothetical protein
MTYDQANGLRHPGAVPLLDPAGFASRTASQAPAALLQPAAALPAAEWRAEAPEPAEAPVPAAANAGKDGHLETAVRRLMIITGSTIGLLVVCLAVLGAIGSFHTVRRLARPFFGNLDWIVPLGVDIGIFAFLAADLWQEYLASKELIDRGLPFLRWIAWAFTAATVYINASAAHGNPVGIVMHAAMPGLFVTLVEGVRVTIRRWARLARRRERQRENGSGRFDLRWILLFGGRAFGLWRRAQEHNMLLACRPGLQMEQIRTTARVAARQGRRWHAPRAVVRAHVAAAVLGPPPTTVVPGVTQRRPLAQSPKALTAAAPSGASAQQRGGKRPARPAPPSATSGPTSRPPAVAGPYSELASALAEAARLAAPGQVRALLDGRTDLAAFTEWLGSTQPRGVKRLLALVGLAANHWTPGVAVAQWIAARVPGPTGRVDKNEIRRMASVAIPAATGGASPGVEGAR